MLLRWYQARLAKQPLLTQSIASAILFSTGDVLAQQVVEKKGWDKHDLARTGRMCLYGGAIFGPAATTWFRFLQNNVVLKGTKTTIAARVLADQALFAPTNMFMFLSSMSIMEGTDPIEKLKNCWWPGYKANCMVWPAVQVANFSLVPLQHRVLVVNVISLGWNCFLSIINSEG